MYEHSFFLKFKSYRLHFCNKKTNRIFDHFRLYTLKALFVKTLKFQLCRYFCLRRVDEFSWDKKQIIHNLCSYGSKSCNFKIFKYKYFFSMIKTLKIKKKWKKLLQKN